MNANKIYTPHTSAEFLQIIWQRQKDLGISDYQLARESGVSRAAISRWKAEQRTPMWYQILALFPVVGLEIKILEKD